MPFCPGCGTPAEAESAFCVQCGKKLARAGTPAPPPASASRAPMCVGCGEALGGAPCACGTAASGASFQEEVVFSAFRTPTAPPICCCCLAPSETTQKETFTQGWQGEAEIPWCRPCSSRGSRLFVISAVLALPGLAPGGWAGSLLTESSQQRGAVIYFLLGLFLGWAVLMVIWRLLL